MSYAEPIVSKHRELDMVIISCSYFAGPLSQDQIREAKSLGMSLKSRFHRKEKYVGKDIDGEEIGRVKIPETVEVGKYKLPVSLVWILDANGHEYQFFSNKTLRIGVQDDRFDQIKKVESYARELGYKISVDNEYLH